MKQLSFFLVLILLSVMAFSQKYPAQHDSTQVFYAELGAGIAIPQSNFKYDNTNDATNYALNGINLCMNAKTYFNGCFGLKYNANLAINSVDDDYYVRNSSSESITRIGYWTNLYFGIGPVLYAPIGSGLLEISVSGGFVSSTKPSVIYNLINTAAGVYTYTYKEMGGFGLGFSYSPEVSYLFKIVDRTYLKLYANYVSSNVNINYKVYSGTISTATGELTYLGTLEHKLNYRSINSGIAVIFELNSLND